MKYLFLDDERIPSDVTWVKIEKTNQWEIVRSFTEAVDWVLENGIPDIISFDHDLGYSEFYTNKNGYDFAKWLVDYDLEKNLISKEFKFTVHSMNPVGAKNIKLYLENYLNQKNKIGNKSKLT